MFRKIIELLRFKNLKITFKNPTQHRRKINAQIDAEQRSILGSDNLREYATNLARGYSQNHD